MRRATPFIMTGASIGTIALSALILSSAAIAAPAARQPAIIVYPVKKGDTLSELAARYLLGTDTAHLIQRLNHIADPRRMPVGLRLRVPARLLRQEPIQAIVHSFSGPVVIASNGRTLAVASGMRLSEGSIIRTGANAFVSLRLPDGSVVTMPSQTDVSIGWLRRTPLTGSVERRFDVKAGRLRAVVTPMTDPRSSFRVTTPVAVSAVRGTEFRVSYDPALESGATEVLTGKVAVSNMPSARRSSITLVQAGFGETTHRTAKPSSPIPLLPAPEPVEQSGRQRDLTVSFAVKPVAGAISYRLQIARDAGFLELVSETASAEPRFSLAQLPNGTYFSRIAAIDSAGLEGRSDVYGFQRRLHGITTSMERQSGGGQRNYLFRWSDVGGGTYVYRFQLSRCGSERTPVIDQSNVANLGLVVSSLPAGTYCWRVQSLEVGSDGGDVIWSEINKFTIRK